MRSANPALKDDAFLERTSGEAMTVQGSINKTFILLLVVIAAASFTWSKFLAGGVASVSVWLLLGVIGGFIAALVTIFKKDMAPITAPIYALFEGLFLGAVSSMLEMQYPGLVIQAVGLTFGTALCMLGAYRSGLIQVNEKFKLGLLAATGGIALVYLVGFVLQFFGMPLPLFGNGIIGIGFSVFVVVIAALNLVMDFDLIETGAANGAPKYMEWYGAFALMVTLIWLYIEILRLLTKLRSSRD
ncbi:MAG: Bax inhibitor-1/YccA family protein [Candidatus Margulisiibacteriota bacterium]